MKQVSKILVVAFLAMSVVALSACNNSSGSAAAPSAGAKDDGGGGLDGISQTPGYVGSGYWSNWLKVTNTQAYQQFLQSSGLCWDPNCLNSGYFLFDISTGDTQNGMLPGYVLFSLKPYVCYGQYSSSCGYTRGMQQYAFGYINAANNGMLLNYYGNRYLYDPANTTNPQSPTLQMQVIWANADRSQVNVNILANGVVIASGNLNGFVRRHRIIQPVDIQPTLINTVGNHPIDGGGNLHIWTPPTDGGDEFPSNNHNHNNGGSVGGSLDIFGSSFSLFIYSFNSKHAPKGPKGEFPGKD